MAARTTSKKSTRSNAVAAALPSLSTLRTAFIVVASSAAIGGLAFAAWTGLPRLRDWANSRATIDAARVQVKFTDAPTWLPPTSLDGLAADAREALDGSNVLDSSAL